MIPQIKRILYATDLSNSSAYVLRYAIDSAKKHDARIIILHVLDTMPALVKTNIAEDKQHQIFKEKKTYTLDRIQKRLKIFCEREFRADPECNERIESIEVREGFAAEVILRKADEFNCDLIIMGTHSKGIIQNAFLGSTAKRVLRRTRKPVFIVPLPKGELDITFRDI
ncbi:MAG: universal stress protein [Desulfobacterales bacterium]|jgi:nucleotide-binding universal stress UspA family protein